jgi:acetylornithine deacetylase/succinyl-diaminopimelate desuccinylase-like protein
VLVCGFIVATELASQASLSAGDEAVAHLQALLRIDTTNPPGREGAAATYIADSLRADGLEPVLLEREPGRSNLVARLRGTGEAAPLLLTAHLDVVEADAARWSHPPFAAEQADGCIWGRGAVDMKNMAALCMTVLKLLKRTGVRLRRDVIFAAVADEEAGSDVGARFLVEEHPDQVRAEFALGEVGGFTLHLGGRSFYPIQVAEKGLCWVRARTRGAPGHGSLPRDDNANIRLARAVAKLGSTRLPQHVTREVTEFIGQVSAAMPLAPRLLLRRLLDPRTAPVVLRLLPDKSVARSFAAILSNTATPTVLRGGQKINVIPAEASCDIDGRILPGQDEGTFLRELRAVLGPEVDITVLRSTAPVMTTPKSALYDTLCRVLQRHDPAAIPVPYLIPGFTDAQYWSRLGTKCYGFAPLRLEPTSGIRFSELFHGDNERIPVAGFRWGLGVLYDVVHEFCA